MSNELIVYGVLSPGPAALEHGAAQRAVGLAARREPLALRTDTLVNRGYGNTHHSTPFLVFRYVSPIGYHT